MKNVTWIHRRDMTQCLGRRIVHLIIHGVGVPSAPRRAAADNHGGLGRNDIHKSAIRLRFASADAHVRHMELCVDLDGPGQLVLHVDGYPGSLELVYRNQLVELLHFCGMMTHRDHRIPERLGIQPQRFHKSQTRGVEPQCERSNTTECAVGSSALVKRHGNDQVPPLAQHLREEGGIPDRKLGSNKNFLRNASEHLIRLPFLGMLRHMEDCEADVRLKAVGRIFVLGLHDRYQGLAILFLHNLEARLAGQQRRGKLTWCVYAGPVPIRPVLTDMNGQKILAHIVQSHEK
mmetsp:Transcript_27495/g.71329  ORF Transcript_27495/g.71329 Transcript_27495/m.71329 type:complete len:290 (-) Transcript_27495:1478-2347(-)